MPGGPERLLASVGCGPDVTSIEDVPVLRQLVVWVTLEHDDPRLAQLFRLLKEGGCEWFERHKGVYSEEEMNAAPLLVMQPNGACEIEGGVKWGTVHDLSSGCAACGTGSRQASALFVNGEQLATLEGHRAASTHHWHVLLDERLASELEHSGVSGLVFHNVYAVMGDGRQVKLRFRQMGAGRVLPPMSPRSSGVERARVCPVCNRNGYFTNTQEELPRFVYRAADVRSAEDVAASWENVGFARLAAELKDSLLSRPWMLVTPRVRRILVDAGVNELDWTPIELDEE